VPDRDDLRYRRPGTGGGITRVRREAIASVHTRLYGDGRAVYGYGVVSHQAMPKRNRSPCPTRRGLRAFPRVEAGNGYLRRRGRPTYELVSKPSLDVLGQQSFYMGSSGMGTTMKLVVNTLAAPQDEP